MTALPEHPFISAQDAPTSLVPQAAPRPRSVWHQGLAAAAFWLAAALATRFWPGHIPGPQPGVGALALLETLAGLALAALALAPVHRAPRLEQAWRWLLALPTGLFLWQALTSKSGLLPLPFFPGPEAIVAVFTEDWPRLGESIGGSLLLLVPGYALGASIGFALGTAIGWSRAFGYWAHPVMRFIGPLPATAWLPIAFFFFPSARSASIFLIALASGFPVMVLTTSGISGVAAAYYDIARNLGADARFLIRKVAIPAALPSVFVGLFMGLGGSFAVLIVAEMMGVKAGLGFYLQWAQGWAAYANFYAALLVMAALFSGLIQLLFTVRDRVLAWQKGILRW